MRSTALDFSRVDLQVELYESLHSEGVDPVEAQLHEFTTDCFLEVARAIEAYEGGEVLTAYRRVARLEHRLERRLRHHPEDIDTHAMAGNYALAFAGILPIGKERRLGRAIEHLEIQQTHWSELTPGARNENVAPNVRAVWTFMLAETLTAAGETERAKVHYDAVIDDDGRNSLARDQLARVSRERLSQLENYAGRDELLPVWPSGPAGCLACHSRHATLPTEGLFTLDP